MSIANGDLLKINNTTIPGIKEYKVGRNKLWKDADRNMNGDVRATLIGVFPKISIVFRDALTEDEVSTICALLDEPYFNVTYHDAKLKQTRTAQYYAGDYEPEILDRQRKLYKSFSVNLIPVSKM
ncbi:hypothetical protein IKD67_01825 [Candidatus Saccharibacteria bacterium]|nr:hypothetical protein [Candidatus Saccharibacteria bacterium]